MDFPNNLGPDLAGKPVNETMYRGMIGSLMYLTTTRPCIQLSTCLCVRYRANLKESYLIVVKRIFKYLKGTLSIGMWYPKCFRFDLNGYSDYVGCNMDRKSTLAFVSSGAVARRAVDKLMDFSGEKKVPKYIKFFILQQIIEARRFANLIRKKARTVRTCITQLNAMISKMEAMDDQEEVYNSLFCLRESKRAKNNKVIGLNKLIAEAEEDISVMEGHAQIMKADRALFIEELDSLGVRPVPAKLVEFLKEIQMKDIEMVAKLQILEREIELNAGINDFEAHRLLFVMMPFEFLLARMKVWFTRARTEDESFAGLMHDLCFGLRINLNKNHRLIAKLEALGEQGDTVRSLDHMREIVACDSTKLGVLEQLLDGTHVAICLKDGYVVNMVLGKWVFGFGVKFHLKWHGVYIMQSNSQLEWFCWFMSVAALAVLVFGTHRYECGGCLNLSTDMLSTALVDAILDLQQ
ncbi:hypothetical protein Tco_1098569 [Tanacetum coccineum]